MTYHARRSSGQWVMHIHPNQEVSSCPNVPRCPSCGTAGAGQLTVNSGPLLHASQLAEFSRNCITGVDWGGGLYTTTGINLDSHLFTMNPVSYLVYTTQVENWRGFPGMWTVRYSCTVQPRRKFLMQSRLFHRKFLVQSCASLQWDGNKPR